MASTQRNTVAIILWILGLLGATGYLNPFGFFALLLPLLFLAFGSNFTRNHAKEYFNVLVTSVIIYFIGYILMWILGLFKYTGFDLIYVPLFYFGVLSAFGLIAAISNKRFKAILCLRVFK
jgi:hypothetical protein